MKMFKDHRLGQTIQAKLKQLVHPEWLSMARVDNEADLKSL